ncbi:MAG: AI-2E family transporter [Acidobacteria bacterium]|nr:AI-2E family transporter [Acidobacteriota bacterium]
MPKTTQTGGPQQSPIYWMRWIPAALGILVLLTVLLVSGQIILVPLLISLALAYLLSPVVDMFERRGWSRSSSVLLTLTAATVAFILILIFILPSFWEQLTKSYNQAKELVSDPSRVEPLINRIKATSPQIAKLFERLQDPQELERIRGYAFGWLQSGLFRLVDVTASILDLLLIPFFLYYLLADYAAMRERIERLIPPRFRSIATDLLGKINHVLSSYVRSQLLIALVMGMLYTVGFLGLRVPLALTLGMLSGLLNFVPYLGTLIGMGLSLAFVALDGAGIGRFIGVIAVFIIVQSVEGYYLTPRLLGSRLNMHPLWVLVAIMIGGNLFGLLGIILAVPVIAVAKVLLAFLEDLYQETDFYRHSNLSIIADSQKLITQDTDIEHSRRAIITTSEIRSRIKDKNIPPSD